MTGDVAHATAHLLRDLDGEVWPLPAISQAVACQFPSVWAVTVHSRVCAAVRELVREGRAFRVNTTWRGDVLPGYASGFLRPAPGETLLGEPVRRDG